MNYIKLTPIKDGEQFIYANPNFIERFNKSNYQIDRTDMILSQLYVAVKESPEEILKLIKETKNGL